MSQSACWRRAISLAVYDVRTEAIEPLVQKGAQEPASSIKEVAEKCRKVITIVPNSDAVETGGVRSPAASWKGIRAGDVLMEMTSAYPPSTLKVQSGSCRPRG